MEFISQKWYLWNCEVVFATVDCDFLEDLYIDLLEISVFVLSFALKMMLLFTYIHARMRALSLEGNRSCYSSCLWGRMGG